MIQIHLIDGTSRDVYNLQFDHCLGICTTDSGEQLLIAHLTRITGS